MLLISNVLLLNVVLSLDDMLPKYPRGRVLYTTNLSKTNIYISHRIMYTQTKKIRPIFMVLYLSIQLRCCNTNKTKMFIKCLTHKNGNYLIFSPDLEGLLNLMCTQLFPLSSGS